MDELERILRHYHARNSANLKKHYALEKPYMYMSGQEKERKLFRLLEQNAPCPISELKLLEIGCGRGHKLIDLIHMGFSPEKLSGNELVQENIDAARSLLPASVKLYLGDARMLDLPDASYDIVYQSMVFSSILDPIFRQELASEMWRLVKPGGGILWYDFIYDNPSNPDVCGVRTRELKSLFPEGVVYKYKVTLAPPVSRRFCEIHPLFYPLFNSIRFLRTHVLCWIAKQQ